MREVYPTQFRATFRVERDLTGDDVIMVTVEHPCSDLLPGKQFSTYMTVDQARSLANGLFEAAERLEWELQR